jgi:hypothetical protein
MQRKFITERDIAAYATQGMKELVLEPHMVLTDMARERARAAKIHLVDSGATTSPQAGSPASATQAVTGDVHAQVRAAVIARLGGEPEGLDAIIASILPRLS